MPTAVIEMWGDTLTVKIPKALAEELSLEPGTTVELSRVGQEMVLKALKTRKRQKLSDLLAQCKGKKPSRELITGRVGKELF
jgi:antitoxin MazE